MDTPIRTERLALSSVVAEDADELAVVSPTNGTGDASL
jgi:hypothetical protein